MCAGVCAAVPFCPECALHVENPQLRQTGLQPRLDQSCQSRLYKATGRSEVCHPGMWEA